MDSRLLAGASKADAAGERMCSRLLAGARRAEAAGDKAGSPLGCRAMPEANAAPATGDVGKPGGGVADENADVTSSRATALAVGGTVGTSGKGFAAATVGCCPGGAATDVTEDGVSPEEPPSTPPVQPLSLLRRPLRGLTPPLLPWIGGALELPPPVSNEGTISAGASGAVA